MSAETKKEVLVEYPVDVVYDTLFYIFPVKYYKISNYNHLTHTFKVYDSFNQTFNMKITLTENTQNTTIITFHANYIHAISDITEGGKQAIETILEELLKELAKQEKTGTLEAKNSTIPVVNAENFKKTTNKKHTLSIIIGYILCVLSIILPLTALINYNPEDIIMFTFFITGILCLTMEISLSVILQYYEDPTTITHGRIQLITCGVALIILGLILHPSLILAGILIPLIAISYFIKREKSIK